MINVKFKIKVFVGKPECKEKPFRVTSSYYNSLWANPDPSPFLYATGTCWLRRRCHCICICSSCGSRSDLHIFDLTARQMIVDLSLSYSLFVCVCCVCGAGLLKQYTYVLLFCRFVSSSARPPPPFLPQLPSATPPPFGCCLYLFCHLCYCDYV